MEQTPPLFPASGENLFELELSANSQRHLRAFSRWAKFIGITVLVCLVLVLLAATASFQALIDQFDQVIPGIDQAKGVIVAVSLLALVVCVLWIIFLLRASNRIQQGLAAQNIDRVAEGFQALRVVFTISLVTSALGIVFTIIGFVKN